MHGNRPNRRVLADKREEEIWSARDLVNRARHEAARSRKRDVHRAADGSLWVDYDVPAAAAGDQGACREETRAKAGLGCGDAGSGPVGLVWGAVMHKADEVLGVVEDQPNKGPVQVQARVGFAPLGWSEWSAPFVCASSLYTRIICILKTRECSTRHELP